MSRVQVTCLLLRDQEYCTSFLARALRLNPCWPFIVWVWVVCRSAGLSVELSAKNTSTMERCYKMSCMLRTQGVACTMCWVQHTKTSWHLSSFLLKTLVSYYAGDSVTLLVFMDRQHTKQRSLGKERVGVDSLTEGKDWGRRPRQSLSILPSESRNRSHLYRICLHLGSYYLF